MPGRAGCYVSRVLDPLSDVGGVTPQAIHGEPGMSKPIVLKWEKRFHVLALPPVFRSIGVKTMIVSQFPNKVSHRNMSTQSKAANSGSRK